MTISQLVSRLNEIRAQYGDLNVIIDNDDPDWYCDIDHIGIVETDAVDRLLKADPEEETEAVILFGLWRLRPSGRGGNKPPSFHKS